GGLIDAPQQDRAALERSAEKADSRRGLLIALPAYVYLIAFFAIPFVIVFVYSFATRSRTGRTVLGDWNLDSYARLSDPIVREIAFRSLLLAVVTTVICLVVSYPFAYYIATRRPAIRGLLL